jgi:hypothetical protein
MVVSVIALFVALGGGYAMAFSGSGTLQKGGMNLPDANSYSVVRTMTGIGEVQGKCFSGSGGTALIRFKNTSGKNLTFSGGGLEGGDPTSPNSVGNGQTSSDLLVTAGSAVKTGMYHVSPTDGSKSPQANVQVSVEANNGCTDSPSVHALVLNTQQ